MHSGGPDGELGASLRYLSQRYAMPYPAVQALLTYIGTSVSKLRIYIDDFVAQDIHCEVVRSPRCLVPHSKVE